MRYSLLFLLGTLCSAAHIQRRAAVTDKASMGYATLNGGTTGGGTATPIIVSTLLDLKAAVQGASPKVVLLAGVISGNDIVDVGGNTSLLGKLGAGLEGVGLRINGTENVIIRNIKISNVLATTGDAILTIASSRIWIDHMDLSADMDHENTYYGGLIYVTRGTAGISITFSYLHDHWRASLSGLSNNQTEEAKVSWAFNKWQRLGSRLPSVRWGIYHVLCNYYVGNSGSIAYYVGSNITVENNVFVDMSRPIADGGGGGILTAKGNDGYTPPGGPVITIPVIPEYPYSSCSTSSLPATLNAGTGAILQF